MSKSRTPNHERTALDDCWAGPYTEFDKFGDPTGESFVRCESCGREALTQLAEHADHKPTCPHSDR